MARRLFDRFLTGQKTVTYFDDAALNSAAARHPNINYFIECALSAPNLSHTSAGRTRIHQALRNAGWQQHGYAPLVTRIIVERTFEAPAQ